jgi:hypothetical protein
MAVTPFVGDSAEEVREAKEAIAQKVREFMREHGARRYVFVAEAWAFNSVRRSSDLLDHEKGRYFATNVMGAPIQAAGIRSKNGLLYVEAVVNTPSSASPEGIRRAEAEGFEIITGAEAEQLLADIQAEMSWDGESGATHPRRKEVVVFTAEDRTQALAGTRDIIRSEGGKPHLSELEIDKNNQPAGGRFTELLQERVVH